MHEYGGRPFTAQDGVVVGVEFADQRIYRLAAGAAPVPLTPETGGRLRYADLVLDLPRQRVLAVREDHRGEGEPVNTLVAVPLHGRAARGRGAGVRARLLRLSAPEPGRYASSPG